LDYFASDELWLEANLAAVRSFPEAIFLPGFWSEYGMCTEPSAFGSRCTFPADEFPSAAKVLGSTDDIASLRVPDPRTDGLLPFTLGRLARLRPRIEEAGHAIRFAVARGPLNIASFLMGTTEFLEAMMLEPEKAALLVSKVAAFLRDWIELQREAIPTIDGVLLLDDIVGFIGEREFAAFALPVFDALFDRSLSVRFLHNDAACRVSAPYLSRMGVNLFNMGFDIPLAELRALAGPDVALVGNLPPRDVLAAADPATIARETGAMIDALPDRSRVLFSCGGGMPPGVSTRNLEAFIAAARAR